MKIFRTTFTAALAGALFIIAGPAFAQYQPTGADGITASPKLRQVLDERHRNEAIPVQPEVAKMACPKCTDSVTMRVDYTARGANKPTVPIVTHGCTGCENTIATTGIGKAATTVAIHKCTGCGAENLACCSGTKDAKVATSGMEKHSLIIDAAPVK